MTLLCSQLDQYSQAESTVDEVVVTTESEPNHIIDGYVINNVLDCIVDSNKLFCLLFAMP